MRNRLKGKSAHHDSKIQFLVTVLVGFLLLLTPLAVRAFTVTVVDQDSNPVNGFRWIVEEDTTNVVTPGTFSARTLGVNIHGTYSPVVTKGRSSSSSANINVSSDKRYLVSVLPDGDAAGPRFTMSGKLVQAGASSVTVKVNKKEVVKTAQISVFVFQDTAPINNAPDPGEPGLNNFSILIFDQAGQMSQDAFGNQLGTQYARNADGSFQFNADGAPVIKVPGTGEILTCTQTEVNAFNAWLAAPAPRDYSQMPKECRAVGEALIKYIPPGKYGVRAVPPPGETWIQTSTIEGTPGVDAWVKANEPNRLIEFGPALYHIFLGFVQRFDNLQALRDLQPGAPTATLTGNVRKSHSTKGQFGINPGPPVGECWIGINALELGATVGFYTAPCNADSTFAVTGLPSGTYQLVVWDVPLDQIFFFTSFVVDSLGTPVDLTDTIFVNSWFGNLEGTVFYDTNQNGFRECVTAACDNFAAGDEVGLNSQNINLRWRDGTIYQATLSDFTGEWALNEVFPLFRNYVIEVDFARFKATGATIIVDDGGVVNPNPPFDGKLNPQPQFCVASDVENGTIANYGTDQLAGTADDTLCTFVGQPIIHPFRGDNLARLEQGAVLTQATTIYADQVNIIDWGKVDYQPGENGGISGVVVYATTRAEDDPQLAATDPWEPGIPRVQVNLYADWNNDGVIDDADGNGRIELADVDNYPFQWAPQYQFLDDGVTPNPVWTGRPGPEDINRSGNGKFSRGDALNIATSDSWDDNMPVGCQGDVQFVYGQPVRECAETLRTWNTVRPGVFDGGWAFTSYFTFANPAVEASLPGGRNYIVEAVPPPGYLVAKEEDRNVDFGDAYVPSILALPVPCVGTPANQQPAHVVPPFLTLFPNSQIPAPRAGQTTPVCNMKQIFLADMQNAAADFHFFTEVPKAARGVGLINNDVALTLDPANPILGEKAGAVWLPISVQDFNGNELTRVYTDQFGTYNFIVSSSYTVNAAIPTGVSPHMLRLCLNHPGPIPDPVNSGRFITDPYFDNRFSLTCYTFDFWPGKTTYLDTPVIPVAAFTAVFNSTLDCEQPNGTPVIADVTGPGAVGPIVNEGQTLTIISAGRVTVPNPDCNIRFDPTCAPTVIRDYGFGSVGGTVKINGGTIPDGNVTWTNETIAVNVPAGTTTGQLEIIRGDNNRAAVTGITVTIGPLPAGQSVWTVKQGESIQGAIDAALPNDLIIVRPGTYVGNFIINKKVKLQGSGAFSTVINAAPTLPENLQTFRQRVQTLIDADQAQLVPGENLDLHLEFAAITVIPKDTWFVQADNARIDGFFLSSATSGGGVTVNGFADYLQISNNRIMNNAGAYGGGIRLGTPTLTNAACGANYCSNSNENISIHHNQILMNGSVGATTGGGGVAIHNGATNYQVTDNYICGNFTTGKGAGISQIGLSSNGLIARNKILLNESSFNSVQGGEGGGILLRGEPALAPATLSPGTGNVKILDNLIQGNIAGNGKGGGIFVSFANGLDVQQNQGDSAAWYGIDIFNNMVVNNVAGWVGGGIYLEDAAKVRIAHNTVANNSSTATGASALLAVGLNQPTVPTGAGVVGGVHTAGLAGVSGQTYANPLLKNNIIWHNASFGYQPNPNDPLTGIFPDPANPAGYSFWDLQVFNSIVEGPDPGAVALNPANCVLTSLTGPDGVNYAVNGNLVQDPLFVEDFIYTLQSASAPGEGGNTVQVSFTPIGPRGDYHLQDTSLVRGIAPVPVPAIPEVATDYDGEARPFPADTGADQYYPPPTVTFGDLKLTGPSGAQIVKTGETLTITWTPGATFPPGVTYKLMVSYKNGKQWKKIPGAEALTGTTFDWVVPVQKKNMPQTLLRIQAFNGKTLIGQDITPEPFEVEVVKVLYPSEAMVEVTSGLTLAPPFGINFRFNQTKSPVTDVKIDIALKTNRKGKGKGWKAATIAEGNPFPITNPVPGQEYQVTWTIPEVTETVQGAKIRVRLLSGGRKVAEDESDLPIRISPPIQ